jgi:hypothetical protein
MKFTMEEVNSLQDYLVASQREANVILREISNVYSTDMRLVLMGELYGIMCVNVMKFEMIVQAYGSPDNVENPTELFLLFREGSLESLLESLETCKDSKLKLERTMGIANRRDS